MAVLVCAISHDCAASVSLSCAPFFSSSQIRLVTVSNLGFTLRGRDLESYTQVSGAPAFCPSHSFCDFLLHCHRAEPCTPIVLFPACLGESSSLCYQAWDVQSLTSASVSLPCSVLVKLQWSLNPVMSQESVALPTCLWGMSARCDV